MPSTTGSTVPAAISFSSPVRRIAEGRYRPLALLLADDRLWVNAASTTCTQLFAVELASLERARGSQRGLRRAGADIQRIQHLALPPRQGKLSLGIDDGLDRDEHEPSTTEFPFLAPPDAQGINH